MLQEQWERRWKDYYQSLGIDPGATATEILEAFRYKAQILHPDRLATASPRVRQRAERDFKEVNEAYEVLRDAIRRSVYHAAWVRRQQAPRAVEPRREAWDIASQLPPDDFRAQAGEDSSQECRRTIPRPVPILSPSRLVFSELPAGAKRTASFLLSNSGGRWSELRFRKSKAPWLTLVRRKPIDDSSPLPLRVEVEVDASEMPPGATFAGVIEVWLDDRVARLPVNAQTVSSKQRPTADSYSRSGSMPSDLRAGDASGTTRFPNTGFWVSLFLAAWAAAAGAFLLQVLFPSAHTSRLGETALEGLSMAAIIGVAVWGYFAPRRS